MLGNGLSGILMNVLKAVLQICLPGLENQYKVALIFFSLAAVILFVCGVAFQVLNSSEFFLHYKRLSEASQPKQKAPILEEDTDAEINEEQHMAVLEARQQEGQSFRQVVRDLKEIIASGALKILMAIWLVFFITFAIFPGAFFQSKFYFLDFIADKRGASEENTWYELIMILLFNVMDTVGRYLGGKVQMKGKTAILIGYCRLIFIPSTILIGLKSKPLWLFDADWFKVLNMVLFALSNGFVSTLCAI